MKSYKAPGSNGFQPLFFKHFWELVKEDLWSLVYHAFASGMSDATIAEILIVLIPKVDQPTHFKELHPISLCNVAYNVITKVVVQHLCPLLNYIIGPLQSSFILGRGTKDSVIFASRGGPLYAPF